MFTTHYTIVFFRNRIRVTNKRTNAMRERTSDPPFSCEHWLLGDPARASRLLKELVSETQENRWFVVWATADVSVGDGSARKTDLALMQQLVVEQGFSRVRLS